MVYLDKKTRKVEAVNNMKKIELKENDVLVFQGDSVTDCNCSKEDNSYLGNGYVALIAAQLLFRYPELNLTIYNKGYSGNRIYDMEDRFDKDCLDLKPTVITILIGINDTWRRFDSNLISKPQDYLASYKRILDKTLEKSKANLILMDPFLLPDPPDRKAWREDLDARITIVRNLAKEYQAAYIPLDSLFYQASINTSYSHWCFDGVHPTLAGHNLIAAAWLKNIIVKY